MRWKNTIVLVVFGRGGLVASKIRRVELVGLGEQIRWLGDLIKINFCDIFHLLEL